MAAINTNKTVEILHGSTGLDSLKNEWRQLEQDTKARFYSGYDWHAAWLAHLEPHPESVFFAVLKQHGKCMGILPLLPRRKTSRWQPQILEIPRRKGMDLTMPILASDTHFEEWWPILRKALKANGFSSFILLMTGVLQEESTLTALSGTENHRVIRVQGYSCRFDCRLPYNNISAGYTNRLKKILRRGKRKLEADGALELRSWRGESAISEAYPEFLRLEASGWKAIKGTALALDQSARKFHEDLLFSKDAKKLQINLLLAGNKPIAGQLCIIDRGTISLLKIAFDQEKSQKSPGSVLLDKLVHQCCIDDTIDTLDLITGQPWMHEWNPQSIKVADVWLFDRIVFAKLAGIAVNLRERLRELKDKKNGNILCI